MVHFNPMKSRLYCAVDIVPEVCVVREGKVSWVRVGRGRREGGVASREGSPTQEGEHCPEWRERREGGRERSPGML